MAISGSHIVSVYIAAAVIGFVYWLLVKYVEPAIMKYLPAKYSKWQDFIFALILLIILAVIGRKVPGARYIEDAIVVVIAIAVYHLLQSGLIEKELESKSKSAKGGSD